MAVMSGTLLTQDDGKTIGSARLDLADGKAMRADITCFGGSIEIYVEWHADRRATYRVTRLAQNEPERTVIADGILSKA